MRRLLALPAAVIAAASLTACALVDQGGSGSAPPDSTTAMEVAEDARLEFRLIAGNEGTDDAEECFANHLDTGGVSPATEAGPDEEVTMCADLDGVIYEATFAPAFTTGEHVSYIDYDYGTAGIPTVYVVFDEEGAAAWNAATVEQYGGVEIMVGGVPYLTTGMMLTSNDVHQIQGLGTIGEAEDIATALATGVTG